MSSNVHRTGLVNNANILNLISSLGGNKNYYAKGFYGFSWNTKVVVLVSSF